MPRIMLMPRKAFPDDEPDDDLPDKLRGWRVEVLAATRKYLKCNFVNPKHRLTKPIWYEAGMLEEINA